VRLYCIDYFDRRQSQGVTRGNEIKIQRLRSMAMLLASVFLVIGAEAKELRMIAAIVPPHFDKDGTGRIGDVVRSVLERCGHSVKFTMVPMGRNWKDYSDNESFDGMATAEADQVFPGYTTKPFMYLQDGAFVAANSGLGGITSVEQLRGKRIVAFPDADKILGIGNVIPQFKSFSMHADKVDQVRPLLAGRADALLGDGLITAHFIQIIRERGLAGNEPEFDPSQGVIFRKIFVAAPQRLFFREEAIARDFDRCFQELVTSGEIERLSKPYLDRYRDILGGQYPNY
jgi:polar amino acid transport system substrate-binding protein